MTLGLFAAAWIVGVQGHSGEAIPLTPLCPAVKEHQERPMKTTIDILSAVIEDARYYLKRNVPDMRIDPKVVLDMAMDADRCAVLETENRKLQAVVDAARHWRQHPATPNAAALCRALDSLDEQDPEEEKAEND